MKKLKLAMVLKGLMKEKELSTRDLSHHTGIPQSTLSNFLLGRGSHRPEQIFALSSFFGVSMEFLLFNEKSKASLQELLTEEVFTGWLKVRVERCVPDKPKFKVDEDEE